MGQLESSAERGEQSGAEQSDIRGDKTEMHAQVNFRKREVACINRDIIPRFSKDIE